MDRLTDVSKNVDGKDITNSYAYENDKIKTITHNGFSYSFDYDSLGNNIAVNVGTQNLIKNNYDLTTGNLLQSTYGNGQIVSSDYDNLDRVVAKNYYIDGKPQQRYTYQYDAAGNLGYQQDLVNNVSYRYVYDLADRLAKVVDSQGNSTVYGYDGNNNKNKFTEKINGKTYDVQYSNNHIMYTYDSLGRKTRDAYITPTQFGSNGYYVDYTYTDGAGGSTTTKVSSVNFLHKGRTINYNYDSKGNIDTITDNNKKIKYYYNELNEVTREDNQVLNKTIVYTYDAGGNILTKTEYNYTTDANPSNPVNTYNYAYGDSNWKDKLTSYNGKTITYDAIGNPLTYDGWTFTWEEGRQLSSMSKTGTNISYKYNDKGIRTEKSVNGVVTKYHLNGDDVTYEDNGTDKIYYTYDSSGKLISMNLNGTEYYYTRNAQGDIIGLFDTNGNDVVSYTYDTWGKVVSIDGSLKDTVGVKNPYRYRGYRFDTETGLYYLNARYYNPELGRFINADSIGGKVGELLSHNVFAYCTNNHVNLKDSNGNWPTLTDIWNGIKNSWNYVSKQVQVSVKIAIVTIAVAVGVKYIENKVVSRKNFKSKSNAGWDMPQRGKIINGREYSKHALERMAPKTPQVKAELEQRALVNGLKRGTKAFEKYVDPRGVPPMVVEDAIQNGTRLPGNMPGTWEHITNDVKVITNDAGKVITIYPK